VNSGEPSFAPAAPHSSGAPNLAFAFPAQRPHAMQFA
jgi:hypothetical protein